MIMTTTTYQVDQVPTNKMKDYRAHLRTITNGLEEMAKAAGRTKFTKNQLLRECYNLIDKELLTFEQWKEQGAYVRRGEHAYLFWGKPITTEAGYNFSPVQFLFSREQVRFMEVD
jgi:hypothetical protein